MLLYVTETLPKGVYDSIYCVLAENTGEQYALYAKSQAQYLQIEFAIITISQRRTEAQNYIFAFRLRHGTLGTLLQNILV